jgi:HSP20 family molecular chaperone IbpA
MKGKNMTTLFERVMPTAYKPTFRQIEDAFTEADLLFKNVFDASSTFDSIVHTKLNYPVDISETDKGLLFEVAVVGLDKKDISIKTESNVLRISYVKPELKEEYPKYIYRGISRRSFDFSFKISARYDVFKVKANMDKGLLSIEIPFSLDAEPKEVKIG